jgi:hypothetical protein
MALGLAITCLVSVVVSGAVIDQRAAWGFDDLPAGRPPPGFLFPSSPKEQPGQWAVLHDGVNAVLGQLRRGPPGAQLAVVEGSAFGNLVLSVRVRLVGGARSAGVVWRYRDPENYYLASLDLGAQRARIYRIVSGNRTRLDERDDLELDVDAWHLLKVEHRGERMRVLIDGIPVANDRDRMFEDPGAIGLWTSGDSVAWFDDLLVEPAPGDGGRNERRN